MEAMMPVYEYKCEHEGCEERLETVQSIKADALTKCPKCGEETLKRVISAPALVFKGSGFYINDYGRNKNVIPD
jgi:putative FmdB family regulatory protein